MMPRVLVGILAYEAPEDTIATAESLRASTYQNFDLLVVDNASPSGSSQEIANRCPWLAIERNPSNTGYAGGMNSILRRALDRGYDYALLCNNDLSVAPDALDRLVETAESVNQPAIVGGLSASYLTGAMQVAGAAAFNLTLARIRWRREMPPGPVMPVPFVQGALMLFRVSAFEAGLALDESLFMYYEEADLGMRLRQLGLRAVIDARVMIRHRGEDRHLISRNAYLQQRNRVYLVRKYGTPLQYLSHIIVTATLELPVKMLVRTLQGRPRFAQACLYGFIDGIRGRMGTGQRERF